jgi:ATP-binding cassette subfamily B protein
MKQLRTLLPFLRTYRWGFLVGLFFVVVANAFAVLPPRLIGDSIDALSRPGGGMHAVLVYALLSIGAALLAGVGRFGMRQWLNGLSRKVETDLRNRVFERMLRLDAAFFGRNRTGDLMSRATNDTQSVRMAAGPAVMYLANTVVSTVLSLVFMLGISPHLTLLSVIPMLFLPPAMIYFGGLIHRQSLAVQDHLGVLQTLVQENLAGGRIVRAYRQEHAQQAEFEDLNAGYLRRNMDLARTSGIFNPTLTFLAGAGAVIVLWVGGREVAAGHVSVGEFVAFGLYLTNLTWPMIALGWVINLFQRGSAAMERLNLVLESEPAIRQATSPRVLPAICGAIEFRSVGFHYPGTERTILRDLSFRIEPGHTVALVGPTGSGKSTVVALLARIYDPTSGLVLLDGVPLPDLSLDQLRGALGVVAQDAFVFSDTIEENIALGLPPGPRRDAAVRYAAGVAQLDDTIAELPAGYATRLGERGVNLSGGQRQRTTLARAIARDPRILVLDDALSAVDTQTETRILEGLRQVMEGRTSIIVSHRVTAVMNADLILVLDDGAIVERGTHAELAARRGLYATLLRRQLLEEGLEANGNGSEPDRLTAGLGRAQP